MSEASLANMRVALPGFSTVVVRIYGPTNDVRWFARMTTAQRGSVVTVAKKAFTEESL